MTARSVCVYFPRYFHTAQHPIRAKIMKGKQKTSATLCCSMNACDVDVDDDDDGGGGNGGGTSKPNEIQWRTLCTYFHFKIAFSENRIAAIDVRVLHALQYFHWDFDKKKSESYLVELASFWDHLWFKWENRKLFRKTWEHSEIPITHWNPAQFYWCPFVWIYLGRTETVCAVQVVHVFVLEEVIIHAEQSNEFGIGDACSSVK